MEPSELRRNTVAYVAKQLGPDASAAQIQEVAEKVYKTMRFLCLPGSAGVKPSYHDRDGNPISEDPHPGLNAGDR